MGRPKRAADGGVIYHVLNRGNARMTIFEKEGDYEAFEHILEEAVERYGTDLLAWRLLPSHWHLVVKPHTDGELSRFVGWFTLTHTQRWHAHYHNTGSGHLFFTKVVSSPRRGLLSHGLSPCRTQCPAGKSCRASGGLAMEQLMAMASREHKPKTAVGVVARPTITGLVGTCQHTANGCRTIGFMTQCRPRKSIRRRALVKNNGQTIGARKHLRPQGRPKKTTNGS